MVKELIINNMYIVNILIAGIIIFAFIKYIIRKKQKLKKALLPVGKGAALSHAVILSLGLMCLLTASYFDYGAVFSIKTGLAVLKELGFALIIAVVIIYSIEVFSRSKQEKDTKEHIDRISKNVYNAVFGKDWPQTIIDEMHKTVVSHNVYRKNLKVTYEFIPDSDNAFAGRDNYLICHQGLDYNLVNISDLRQEEDISVLLEKPASLNPEFISKIKVVYLRIGSKRFNEEEIASYSSDDDDCHVRYKIPMHLDPRDEKFVSMKSVLYKEKRDVESWISAIPTDFMELSIHIPEEYNVHACANHSQELIKLSSTKTSYRWRIEGAMLPNQSILFWWDKQNTEKEKTPS